MKTEEKIIADLLETLKEIEIFSRQKDAQKLAGPYIVISEVELLEVIGDRARTVIKEFERRKP